MVHKHVSEQIAGAGKTLFGEVTLAAMRWLDEGRTLLISDGEAGLANASERR